jgi:hypothetical protein
MEHGAGLVVVVVVEVPLVRRMVVVVVVVDMMVAQVALGGSKVWQARVVKVGVALLFLQQLIKTTIMRIITQKGM